MAWSPQLTHVSHSGRMCHFVRQKLFGRNILHIRNHARDSKHKPADASNFEGSRKISFIQNERVDFELWSKQWPKSIKRRWPSHDALSLLRSITLRVQDGLRSSSCSASQMCPSTSGQPTSWPSDPVLLYRASRILGYALRVMLKYTLSISGPPAWGNLGICAQYQREFEGIPAPWG